MDYLTKWRLWLPIVSGFGMASVCKIPKNEGTFLPQRPPAIVFKIIWPILYLLLGFSWVNATSQKITDTMHGLLTLLLTLWILTYQCMNNKKMGLYIIACLIAIIISCICLHKNRISKIALTPLLAWLLIAFQLNWNIIKN